MKGYRPYTFHYNASIKNAQPCISLSIPGNPCATQKNRYKAHQYCVISSIKRNAQSFVHVSSSEEEDAPLECIHFRWVNVICTFAKCFYGHKKYVLIKFIENSYVMSVCFISVLLHQPNVQPNLKCKCFTQNNPTSNVISNLITY